MNTVITYTGVLIGFVSLLFVQPRLLNTEELGLTRILIAGASLISTILPLGVSSVTTKFFPYFRDREKKHYGYFGFMLLFPLLGTLICAILIYVFKGLILSLYVEESPLFVRFFDYLLPFAVIMSLNMALNAYSSSLFKTTMISLWESVLTRVLFILLIVLYYLHWLNLEQFIKLFVAIYLLQVVSMLIYVYRIDTPSFKFDRNKLNNVGLGKMVTFGLMLTLTNASSLSLKHLDAIMIGKYLNLSAVGIFAVAAYIAYVIEVPLNSLERITHTKVSQAWADNDREYIKKIYYQSVRYLMLLGGLLLVGIVCNVQDLLGILPEAYHQGTTVAIIACVGSFLNVATGVNTSILFTSSKYLYGTFLLVFLMILTVTLNVLLIPRYGIEGAAVATVSSLVIYNIIKYLILLKHFKMQPYDLSSLKILLVILLSFLVGFFLPEMGGPWSTMILRSILIVAVYGISTYFLRIVPEFHKYIGRG